MDIDQQVTYLMQGTEYGDAQSKEQMAGELRQRLLRAAAEGRPLRVYCGFDPRTSDLHIGHTVQMRKLRQFQELGHDVTFLIGNFTSLIGDPSDKDKLRPLLTPEQIAEHGQTYAEQAFRILDRDRTRVRYNAEWLSKLTFADLIKLASNFTIQQFLQRENFRLRWERGEAVYLHETFYAIMQGYDAFSMKADVQVGGTDQLFNIMTAARKVMAYLGEEPNVAIILGILPGTDGVIKMSKSLGNAIPLNSTPEDMFGKVMSVPDLAMPLFMKLVTRWTPPEIDLLEQAVAAGRIHPREAKEKLAFEIVSSLYDDVQAHQAQVAFARVFQRREAPDEMPDFNLRTGQTVLDVLILTGMIASKSEGRRLLTQKGIRLDGEPLADGQAVFPHPGILQVGKRKYIRILG